MFYVLSQKNAWVSRGVWGEVVVSWGRAVGCGSWGRLLGRGMLDFALPHSPLSASTLGTPQQSATYPLRQFHPVHYQQVTPSTGEFVLLFYLTEL